jgi:hypothetical protein
VERYTGRHFQSVMLERDVNICQTNVIRVSSGRRCYPNRK